LHDSRPEAPISLQRAAERLEYFGEFARFALDDRLGTGRVPAFAYRSDLSAMMHDHIEHLLAKAHNVYVFSADNRILAYYLVSSEQEVDALFGPRSNWRSIEWNARGLEIEFTDVVVDWPKLYESLRESGKWHPADETKAALRQVGQWSDSWEPPGGSGPADEAPHVTEPRGDTLIPAPRPKIHKAITTVYDTAKAVGEKPPNVNQVIGPVQALLRADGYSASGHLIRELAGADQYQSRRRKPGRTVASERRQQAR
jgi:hypothetical protein